MLSPAGARVVTGRNFHAIDELFVAVPRRGASCYNEWERLERAEKVAVPRRGASCYMR